MRSITPILLAALLAPLLAPSLAPLPAAAQDWGERERARADDRRGRAGTGFRVGPFLIAPEIALDQSFDSNVFLAPSGAVDTYLLRVRPTLAVESTWRRHALKIDMGAEAGVFTHDGDDNYVDAYLSVEGELDVTRSVRFGAALVWRRNHERRGTDDVPDAAAEPVVFGEIEGKVQGDIIVTPLRLTPFASFRKLDFQDVPALGGGEVNQDDRDRIEIEAGAEAAILIRRGYQGFVRATYLFTDYEAARDDLGLDRDSSGFRVAAGAEARLSRLLEGRLALGYEWLDFSDPALAPAEAITVEGGIAWRPTRRIEAELEVTREIRQTTVANASSVTVLEGRLDGRYELLRTLTLNASARFAQLEFDGTGRTDMVFGTGLSGDWEVSRTVTLSPGYTFEVRDSDAPGFDYRVHRVFLDAAYRF